MDDFIRDSFSENENDFLNDGWDSINEKLGATAGDLDHEIGEAFSFNEELPAGSWEIIQDGLDVETVWGRLLAVLSRKKRRIIYARWVGLLALLVTSFTFVILFTNSQTTLQKDNHSLSALYKFEKKRESNAINSIESFNSFLKLNQNNSNSNQQQIVLGNNSVEKVEQIQKGVVKSDKLINQLAIKESENSKLVQKELKLIKTLNLTPIPNVLNNIQYNDQFSENPIKIEDKRDFEAGFSIGVCGQLSHVILTDPENTAAFSKSSNSKSKFELSSAFGLTGEYTFKSGIFIQTSLLLRNGIKRSIGNYEKLTYMVKRTELDYQSINFNVGKKIPLNYAKSATFNFAVGGYYSRLRSANIYRNEVLIDNNPNLNKNDFGVNCKLTFSRRIKNFSGEVGVNSSFGLKNIKSVQNQVNTALNHGSLISNGVYFGVAYHF